MATKPRKTKSVKEPSYKINTGEGDGFTAVISGLENIGSIADTTGLSKGLSNFIDKANADLRQQKYAEWANNKIASKAASAKAKIDMANARANHNRSGGTAELLAGTGIFTHPHSVGQPVRQHSSVNEYLGKTVSKRHAEALAAKNAPYTPIDLGRWEGQSKRGRRNYAIGGATTVGMYADRYGSGGYHLNSTTSGLLEGANQTSLFGGHNLLNERRPERYLGGGPPPYEDSHTFHNRNYQGSPNNKTPNPLGITPNYMYRPDSYYRGLGIDVRKQPMQQKIMSDPLGGDRRAISKDRGAFGYFDSDLWKTGGYDVSSFKTNQEKIDYMSKKDREKARSGMGLLDKMEDTGGIQGRIAGGINSSLALIKDLVTKPPLPGSTLGMLASASKGAEGLKVGPGGSLYKSLGQTTSTGAAIYAPAHTISGGDTGAGYTKPGAKGAGVGRFNPLTSGGGFTYSGQKGGGSKRSGGEHHESVGGGATGGAKEKTGGFGQQFAQQLRHAVTWQMYTPAIMGVGMAASKMFTGDPQTDRAIMQLIGVGEGPRERQNAREWAYQESVAKPFSHASDYAHVYKELLSAANIKDPSRSQKMQLQALGSKTEVLSMYSLQKPNVDARTTARMTRMQMKRDKTDGPDAFIDTYERNANMLAGVYKNSSVTGQNLVTAEHYAGAIALNKFKWGQPELAGFMTPFIEEGMGESQTGMYVRNLEGRQYNEQMVRLEMMYEEWQRIADKKRGGKLLRKDIPAKYLQRGFPNAKKDPALYAEYGSRMTKRHQVMGSGNTGEQTEMFARDARLGVWGIEQAGLKGLAFPQGSLPFMEALANNPHYAEGQRQAMKDARYSYDHPQELTQAEYERTKGDGTTAEAASGFWNAVTSDLADAAEYVGLGGAMRYYSKGKQERLQAASISKLWDLPVDKRDPKAVLEQMAIARKFGVAGKLDESGLKEKLYTDLYARGLESDRTLTREEQRELRYNRPSIGQEANANFDRWYPSLKNWRQSKDLGADVENPYLPTQEAIEGKVRTDKIKMETPIFKIDAHQFVALVNAVKEGGANVKVDAPAGSTVTTTPNTPPPKSPANAPIGDSSGTSPSGTFGWNLPGYTPAAR